MTELTAIKENASTTSPSAFHVMLKPRGAICNLDCAYCYYLAKEMLYPGSRFRMARDLLEEYTRQYIEAQRVPEVTFAWHGGEPTLMGLDFFRLALEFQQKYARPGMRILNTLQTNGTTLNDEWCQFFHENDFLIGLSLDGPRELHDAYRLDKAGKPTFDRVMAGLTLLKAHHVEFNILTTLHAANVHHPLEVYTFLREEVGTQFIQFIPIVEHETAFHDGVEPVGAEIGTYTERSLRKEATDVGTVILSDSEGSRADPSADSKLPLRAHHERSEWERMTASGYQRVAKEPTRVSWSENEQRGSLLPTISNRSITGQQYGDFLIAVFDEWVRHDVGRIYIQIFDVALAAWVGERPGLCVFEKTCGNALAMEHNGDVYSCDHFVEPRYKLGNIRQLPLLKMVSSPQQQRFGQDKNDTLPRYCRECSVRFVCNGGCPKDRILFTPDGEPGLNYLCDGYKAFFTHIDSPMRRMAAELHAGRAPANIMYYLAQGELELQRRLAHVGRNDLCPCGSNRKFKKCHGR